MEKVGRVTRERNTWNVPLLAAAAIALAALSACEPYRIEYHNRPSFYEKASEQKLPDRVTLDDGTTIIYGEPGDKSALQKKAKDSERFKIREKTEDGKIILRNMLPEHVLVNALTCLRREEYELLWEQLLSEHTKLALEGQGKDKEYFISFARENRTDLGRTLTRLLLGMPRMETIVENKGQGVIECRLNPRVASQFKFTRARIINEDFGLKLVNIR